MNKNLANYLFLFCVLFSSRSFADARKGQFRSGQKATQYTSFGGNYSSHQNSKEYKISGSYQYADNKFIHEIDLLYDTRYAGTTSHEVEKNLELYDGELSSKILISNSSNYFNYYSRSKYDEFSNYYYDLTNAVGWGRMFFDGIVEADINVGYNEIKNFNSQIVFNPNIKASFWLTDKLKISTKAYIFQVQDSYYEELKTRLTYKISDDLSLEFYHNYDKKRFFYKTSKIAATKTEVSRNLVARIKYDF